MHASQTIAAIEKGLNVLCEKPLSTDIEEVRNDLWVDGNVVRMGWEADLATSTYRPSTLSK